MKDTPFVARAYNLGLKVVPNLVTLSLEQIEYYENNLDQIPAALARGFVIIPEPVLDFTIRVGRAMRPDYPSWMKKVMHPEMEVMGPAEYDLRDLDQWLHYKQKGGTVDGNKIYSRLKKDNALVDCLGLADLLAIQAKGITVFRKLYGGKAVYGWKSVVDSQDDGILFVPFLIGGSGGIILEWCWLGRGWRSLDPALCFRK